MGTMSLNCMIERKMGTFLLFCVQFLVVNNHHLFSSNSICCAFGTGFYKLSVDGEVIKEGGEFGAEEVTSFDITKKDGRTRLPRTPIPKLDLEKMTKVPTKLPTKSPTSLSSSSPTISPASLTTYSPTISPTSLPTYSPTISPTKNPTKRPTKSQCAFGWREAKECGSANRWAREKCCPGHKCNPNNSNKCVKGECQEVT